MRVASSIVNHWDSPAMDNALRRHWEGDRLQYANQKETNGDIDGSTDKDHEQASQTATVKSNLALTCAGLRLPEGKHFFAAIRKSCHNTMMPLVTRKTNHAGVSGRLRLACLVERMRRRRRKSKSECCSVTRYWPPQNVQNKRTKALVHAVAESGPAHLAAAKPAAPQPARGTVTGCQR